MLKQFKWEEKYSVKVAALDAQHKRFFELTNEILRVLSNPNFLDTSDFKNPNSIDFKKQLTLLIVELANYALGHLTYEETCLKSNRCSGCEGHTEVHDKYREKVKIYLRRVRDENMDIYALAQEIAEFSQDWLTKHILSVDRQYIPCLSKENVK